MNRRIHQTGFTDWGEAIIASAAVHVAAAVFIFDLIADVNFNFRDRDTTPEIQVTSLILGTDTVTTSTDQGEGNTPLSNPGENDADRLAAVEPDSLAPVEPDTPEPADSTAETTDPVGAEDARPVDPDTLDPIESNDPQLDVSEPSILRPNETGSILNSAPSVSGAGTAAVAPERIGAVERVPAIVTTSPTISQQNAGDGTEEAAGEINELVRRIRAQLNESCLLAVPQQTFSGDAELVMIGDTDTGMRVFADAVLEGMDPRPAQRSVLVDNRQCGALNYVRQSEAYPAFRLTIALDSQIIESGTNITGTIGNVGGRYVTLVLIDDNGVVQELGEYLSFRGGFARFDVPLTRDGILRDTNQILMAFGSQARPRTVDVENGKLSEEFFTALREELGPNTPMVVVPFELR